MEKLTREQFDALETTPRGIYTSPNRKVYEAVNDLRMGEALKITKDDWNTKSKPSSHALRTAFPVRDHDKNFSVATLLDGSGWAALRVK